MTASVSLPAGRPVITWDLDRRQEPSHVTFTKELASLFPPPLLRCGIWILEYNFVLPPFLLPMAHLRIDCSLGRDTDAVTDTVVVACASMAN